MISLACGTDAQSYPAPHKPVRLESARAGSHASALEPVARQRGAPLPFFHSGRRVASMLLSVASSVRNRLEGGQQGTAVDAGSNAGTTRQTAAAAPGPMQTALRPTLVQNGLIIATRPGSVSAGLKDLLTMQEEEQQSLWSLDAALQACISV